jgi:hypothetical protein
MLVEQVKEFAALPPTSRNLFCLLKWVNRRLRCALITNGRVFMDKPSSAMRDLARRLLAASQTASDPRVHEAVLVNEKLRISLTRTAREVYHWVEGQRPMTTATRTKKMGHWCGGCHAGGCAVI